ncbi:MAG TPA: hypothetical protein VGM30_05095 [Puia sp.]|jgi:hypothetical protein
MKTIFTLLMLPVIVLICFLSGKLYINNQYFISYTLVMTSFLALSLWINNVSTLLQKQRA